MHAAFNPASNPDDVREEMCSRIRALAKLWSGDGMKGALAWAARKAGITPSEAKRLAYREMNSVPAHIADRVRAASRDAQVQRDLDAVDALLARIQRDDLDATSTRALVARLHQLAASGLPASTGEGARSG